MYHTPPNTGSMAPDIEGLSTDFEALGGLTFMFSVYILYFLFDRIYPLRVDR